MAQTFQLVDVFGSGLFSGNPLAVITPAGDIAAGEMQSIARWLNLSETTFLLPPTHPEADYRVRIFTVERELPFAGHPTLGTCHAWLTTGFVPRAGSEIIQECRAGLIRIRRDNGMLAFQAPPLLRTGPVDVTTRAEIAAFLRIDPNEIVDTQWADNGPGWIAVLLASADAVLALEPARHHATRIDIGVIGPHPPDSETAFELRAFFTDQHGALREDPVTGSLNASAAQFLFATGRAKAPYIAAQGTTLGRSGRVHIDRDADGTIWVGGQTQTMFRGTHDL